MKNRIVILVLVLCLLLSGCGGWMDGSYSSVKPHTERHNQPVEESVAASDYTQLRKALVDLVENGGETMIINVGAIEQESVVEYMNRAIRHVLQMNPIGAYAVENVEYEEGTSGGQPSVAVTVTYNRNRAELRGMKNAEGQTEALEIVGNALTQCEQKVVMRVSQFRTTDFVEFVRDYMEENPQTVMELPQVTVNTYPNSGTDRVVEIVFSYQTGADDLKNMQSRVRPLFTSAELYVSGNSTDYDKYELLYAFLMERHEYQFDTSITPTYSLLIHGVGDSRAFATVYAAMCRRVGLECYVVSGTANGEPLFWNMICLDGTYHHLDLVACGRSGAFRIWGDPEMAGYVWDYSAYPECQVYTDPLLITEPTEEPTVEPGTEAQEPTEWETEPEAPTQEPSEPVVVPEETTEPVTELTEQTEPTEAPTEPATEESVGAEQEPTEP